MSWTPPGSAKADWALIAVPLRPSRLPSVTRTQSSTTASDVVPGTAVTDTAAVSGGGPTPTGTVAFFLCQPATVSANGGDCRQGGDQVGAARPLDASGRATSDASADTSAIGRYCWRAEYSGDASYEPSSETTATNECFTTTATVAAVSYLDGGSYSVYGVADSRQVSVPAGPDRLLLFVFAGKRGGDSLRSVTLGGAPLSLLASRDQGSVHLELRYLVAPPAGTATLAWSKTGSVQNVTWGWSVYSGVAQAAPFGAPVPAGATGAPAGTKSVAVAASAGDLVVDGVVFNQTSSASPPTAGTGQTVRWARAKSTTLGGSSDKPAASPVTMSWTPPGSAKADWALIAVPLHSASAS
jgi:hypothetical protein